MRPYLLARVLLGVAVLAALSHGGVVALRALLRPTGDTSESALALDRRAELVAATVRVAAICATLGLLGTVLAADRAHESIRGAMCAFGVLTGTEHGLASLATSALLCLGASAWLALHRIDMALVRGDLVRTKLRALAVLVPLALVDLVYVLRFITELDFDVVASCCSTAADAGGVDTGASGMGGSYGYLAGMLVALTAGAAALLVARRRATRAAVLAGASLVLLGVLCAIPTVVDVVAPHVYGTPAHRCPFCLLHPEAMYVGYPLLVAAVVAASSATSLLVSAAYARTYPNATAAFARPTSGRALLAVAVLSLLVLAPLAQHVAAGGTLLPL